ncbi:MAG: hypothetical protein IJ174_09875 [Clostridia bacterium]|nr:hypothetical protein [Clostridia bacterium]
MLKKVLALVLTALMLIAPFQAMAVTESEWNNNCRFKTTTETTLYDRETNGAENVFTAKGTIPAGSYIIVVSADTDGKRQISYYNNGETAYAWISSDDYAWAVKNVTAEDGRTYSLPETTWGDAEAVRKYMEWYYNEEQIQSVLAVMNSGSAETAPVQPVPVAVPQPTVAPAVPVIVETTEAPVAVVQPTAAPVAQMTQVSANMTAVGPAPTPKADTSYLQVTYSQNGVTQGTAHLVTLGTVTSVIAIGNSAYSIATRDLAWSTSAQADARIAVVSNILMSSAWLRNAGNAEAPRLANVPAGAIVAVLEPSNSENYTRVYYEGRIGYLATGLLSFTDALTESQSAVLSYGGLTYGTNKITVWTGPSLNTYLIDYYTIGTPITVVATNETGDWYCVELADLGLQGWVRAENVTFR